VFRRASLIANCRLSDYEDTRATLDEGYFELSVLEHKTADTNGPLTVFLDTEVSYIVDSTYRP
jgi:hypothetical protein